MAFSTEQRLGWMAGAIASRADDPVDTRYRSEQPKPGYQWPFGTAADGRTTSLFVPDALPDEPLPLMVLLHGATSSPPHVMKLMQNEPVMQFEAEQRKALVFAPKSTGPTWDATGGRLGPDVEMIDRGLAWIFRYFRVDPTRIILAGFSDGASYALSLGLPNGTLFSRILALSPGFIVPGVRDGRPRIVMSHGRSDDILPFDRCGNRIASALRKDGYEVDFRVFDGGHTIPAQMIPSLLDAVL